MPTFHVNRPPPLLPEQALRRRAFAIRCAVLMTVLVVGGGGTALLDLGDIGLQLLLGGLLAGIAVEEAVLFRGRRRLRGGSDTARHDDAPGPTGETPR